MDAQKKKLIPCPDCGHSCSIVALSCPNCGRPFKRIAQSDNSVSSNDFLFTGEAYSDKVKTVSNYLLYFVMIWLGIMAIGVMGWWFGGFDKWLNSQSTRNSAIQARSNNRDGGLSSEAATTANDALRALRKVDAATQVGVSYMNYGSLLIDAQAQVNEALPLLPNGELKKEISLTIEAYNDANLTWRLSNNQVGILFSLDGSADGLRRKYSIPAQSYTDLNGRSGSYVNREDALDTIWRAARMHLDRASSLLQQGR